jgi:CTP synthase
MSQPVTKFIFVTGGVVSSLGKGIVAASLGRLLAGHGLTVTIQKLDPYINVDPGTMSPYQHGEVFVTDDGAETDLDLGHYERFIDQNLTRNNTVTSGSVYEAVISKERHGDYLGATVQVIPHVTNEIKERIRKVANTSHANVVIIEVGGTVGDIESLPFLEAARQFHKDVGRGNCIHIHGTLVPHLGTTGEFKTKPTQHSVKELRAIGIIPDIIFCRSQAEVSKETKSKIALFCDTDLEAVISLPDVDSIYRVPLVLEKENMDKIVLRYLGLKGKPKALMPKWRLFLQKRAAATKSLRVALVGKYVALNDAYLSVMEALKHAGIYHGTQVTIDWINSEEVTKKNVAQLLKKADAIVVPGGFGNRGVEGKIFSIQYAREKKVPYLGLCLGMQTACIEFARNVVGMKGANTTEVDPKTPYPIIDIIESQKENIAHSRYGNTMRLGEYTAVLKEGTIARKAYGEAKIQERHRHRYEVNPQFIKEIEAQGLVFSGRSPDSVLMEIAELPKKDHPFFLGVQFHPEFLARPLRPHPLFSAFIKAVVSPVNFLMESSLL